MRAHLLQDQVVDDLGGLGHCGGCSGERRSGAATESKCSRSVAQKGRYSLARGKEVSQRPHVRAMIAYDG